MVVFGSFFKIYSESLKKLSKEKDIGKCFVIIYFFYSRVFALKMPEDRQVALRVFERYIKQMDEICIIGKLNREHKYSIILWGLVCGAFETLSVEFIQRVISIVGDNQRRSRNTIKKYRKAVPPRQIDQQMGFLLINMETMLQIQPEKAGDFYDDLRPLWERGKWILGKEEKILFEQCKTMYELIAEGSTRINDSADLLKRDYENRGYECRITNLVRD